jgi:hypothetical protein
VPAPRLIWVHGQWSGDMMMDWVPDMCGLPKRVRPLILSGASTQHSGGGRRRAGAGRGHQLMFAGHARNASLGGYLLGLATGGASAASPSSRRV